MDDSARPSRPTPLNGWKEIAAYLGRGVRSVQRYERELGLPIHRLRSGSGQTVYAFAHEIDEWRKGLDTLPDYGSETETPPTGTASSALQDAAVVEHARPARMSSHWLRWATGVLIGASGLAFFIHLYTAHPATVGREPARFVVVGRALEARDEREQVVWKYTFDRDVTPLGPTGVPNTEASRVDFDGRGTSDVVVAIRFAQRGRGPSETDALYAFRPDGSLRWVVRPTRAFTCGGETFEAPWFIQALAVSPGPGPQRLWIAYHHAALWPNFVVEVLSDGSEHLRYIHTGWISALAQWKTPAGSLLAAAGVSNKFDRPTLSMIPDAAGPDVTTSASAPFNCDDVPPGKLVEEVVFPNSEFAPVAGRPRDIAEGLQVLGNDLRVTVGPPDAQIYILGPDLSVKDFYFGDNFWVSHQAFENQGKLTHAVADCPARTAPRSLRIWTRDSGWRDASVTPRLRDSYPQPR